MFYLCGAMKRVHYLIVLIFSAASLVQVASAQCSICTKTAQQLGEGPAQGLNSGIMYLMFTPFIIVGVIGYRWWKINKDAEGDA